MQSAMDEIMYKIATIVMPILFGIISYVGIMTVNWLKSISKSLEDINIKLERYIVKHDHLEERVDKIEERVLKIS